jgi:hypothetical protein
MRRMLLTLSLAAVLVAVPTAASAHVMSLGKARQYALQYVKRQVPGAASYGTGQCLRQGPHGWRCTIAVRGQNGVVCANRVLVRYVRASSNRVRVSELGNAVCS